MSDSSLTDIAARLNALKEQAEAVDVRFAPSGIRFVVATDWSQAAVPLAALKAFRVALAPGSAAELCLATPHGPGPADVECARVLIEGAGGAQGLGSVVLASFDEVLSEAYDSAVVPVGDASLLITEVASFVTRMFDVARRLQANGPDAMSGVNTGNQDALRRRLEAFSA